MNAYNQKPELTPSCFNLFVFFFNQRIIGLEKISSKNMMLSKQMKIRNLRNLIEEFIRYHSYSYFNILVLDEESDYNLDWPTEAIKLRNFELFLHDLPRHWVIAIYPNWEKADFYQLSVTGKRIKEQWP